MDNGSGIKRHHYVYSTYQRSSNAPSKLGPHLCAPGYIQYVARIFEWWRGFRISGEKLLILKRGPDPGMHDLDPMSVAQVSQKFPVQGTKFTRTRGSGWCYFFLTGSLAESGTCLVWELVLTSPTRF
jgi:hypothetical protein